MCISNPIPVFVSLGKCSNLMTVSVKESFTLANTANISKRHIYTCTLKYDNNRKLLFNNVHFNDVITANAISSLIKSLLSPAKFLSNFMLGQWILVV